MNGQLEYFKLYRCYGRYGNSAMQIVSYVINQIAFRGSDNRVDCTYEEIAEMTFLSKGTVRQEIKKLHTEKVIATRRGQHCLWIELLMNPQCCFSESSVPIDSTGYINK